MYTQLSQVHKCCVLTVFTALTMLWTETRLWQRTNIQNIALTSTVLCSETINIFRVHAVVLLRVNVQWRAGALRCRSNVSTAFRRSCLLCFVMFPQCFIHNVWIASTSHVPSQRKSIASRSRGRFGLYRASCAAILLC